MRSIDYLDQVLDNPKDPGKVAVRSKERTISYEKLIEISTRLSHLLISHRIRPDDRVIIFMEKSVESIAAIFGILKSGACYVPVDETIPYARLDSLLQSCKPKFLITHSSLYKPLLPVLEKHGVNLVLFDDYTENSPISYPASRIMILHWLNKSRETDAQGQQTEKRKRENLAYIIYTSGSTGAPKGVMISHRSAAAFVGSITPMIPYDENTRFLNVSPLYFDASIVDIFCTLQAGGQLVLMPKFRFPNQLLENMEKNKITDTLLVSSVLKLLVSRFASITDYDLSSLRTLWYGAEACPVRVISQLKEMIPQLKFIHGYGPTEAAHSTTLYIFDHIPEKREEYFPIGKPLPNIKTVAINEKNEPIQPGEIGELYIGGTQLFQGYCNDLERTRAVVIDNFLGTGERYYRSGDYVTIDRDGNYIFRGRVDDMIKIAGQLVYLSEIEKAALSHDCVKDAILLTEEDALFNKKVVAFIVPQQSTKTSENDLKEYLLTKLPRYMVPSSLYFITEDQIPKTPSGKVDKKILLKTVQNRLEEKR